MMMENVEWIKAGKWEHCLPPRFGHGRREFVTAELTAKDFQWLHDNGCKWVRKYVPSKKNDEDPVS